jgi:hypothetical protein
MELDRNNHMSGCDYGPVRDNIQKKSLNSEQAWAQSVKGRGMVFLAPWGSAEPLY